MASLFICHPSLIRLLYRLELCGLKVDFIYIVESYVTEPFCSMIFSAFTFRTKLNIMFQDHSYIHIYMFWFDTCCGSVSQFSLSSVQSSNKNNKKFCVCNYIYRADCRLEPILNHCLE